MILVISELAISCLEDITLYRSVEFGRRYVIRCDAFFLGQRDYYADEHNQEKNCLAPLSLHCFLYKEEFFF